VTSAKVRAEIGERLARRMARQEAQICGVDRASPLRSVAQAVATSGLGVTLVCDLWFFVSRGGQRDYPRREHRQCVWLYVGQLPVGGPVPPVCALPLYTLTDKWRPRAKGPERQTWDYFAPARELQRELADPLMVLGLLTGDDGGGPNDAQADAGKHEAGSD
jgi:hypothetical protein